MGVERKAGTVSYLEIPTLDDWVMDGLLIEIENKRRKSGF